MFFNPDYHHIHFVGIGGSGISAIARMALAAGKTVTGSDLSSSPVTSELARLGAKIFYRHQAKNVSSAADLVVYTLAVAADNPELEHARKLSLPLLSYPEALALVSRGKYTIAVSGTHGKTTTTAMLAEILLAAAFDPTVIVGSFLLNQRSNFIAGRSRYFLVEACEYRRSFLNLSPRILVITNIDNDHLDYYRDLADIQSAFAELAAKVPGDGLVICQAGERRLAPVIAAAKAKIIDYAQLGGFSSKLELRVPGRHNILNAQAALAAARAVGIDEKLALSAVEGFRGTRRRFEYKGRMPSGGKVFDDYAHHPTEIKATLAAARQLTGGRLRVVFQPHLYSRTKILFNDFTNSFALADEVIITDIYAAREPKDNTVTAESLAQAIVKNGQTARYCKTFAEIKKYLEETKQKDDLILTLGAGDIFGLAEDLVSLV